MLLVSVGQCRIAHTRKCPPLLSLLTSPKAIHLHNVKLANYMQSSLVNQSKGGEELENLTRAYVKRRGPRRKGVKYGCNSL